MKPLADFSDIHSHRPGDALRGDTIVSIEPGDPMLPGGVYSVGIHPWSTERPFTLDSLKKLVGAARDPRVVAIGECGFDRLRGGDMAIQEALFGFHAALARRVGKPLIIHSVKSDDLLLKAAKKFRPEPGTWIIHGFRGKPSVAEALLRNGFALSLGRKYNQDSAEIIPPERLYRESDAQ